MPMLQEVYSRPRKRQLPLPSSRRIDAAVDAADAADVDATAVVVAGSHASPFAAPTLIWKIPSLLFTSIALSSILLPRVGAVNPPTMPTYPRKRDRGASPNSGPITSSDANSEKGNNDNRSSEAVDERETNTTETMLLLEEGSVNLQGNENGRKEESSPYETKSQKQSPPTNNRKQRQKERQKQRQKQQQQTNAKHTDGIEQHDSSQAEYDAYMHWCQKVLGISSIVEIKEFEYLDHLQMHWEDVEREDFDSREFDWLERRPAPGDGRDGDVDAGGEGADPPTKLVRGLAAAHDIQEGDIVVSIPLYSLLSVPTTIDHDPVLSRILGPGARRKYGWTNTAEYELPLLVLALLYHHSLGEDSPISHYIDILLGTPTDSFPFLWSDRELREKTGDGEEVKKIARGIRNDLYEMYDGVMGTLVREKPEWFAPPSDSDENKSTEGGENEWAYSYEKFQWAFALVISRHHYIPIKDFDDEDSVESLKIPTHKSAADESINIPTLKSADSPPQMQETLSTVSEVGPPANQPTDSWVDLAKNEEHVIEDDPVTTDDDIPPQSVTIKHSFLAPLADLINFGPPCLRGTYNAEERVFDLIATCPFAKGQEVTFWYSSDCSDVIIANFGFMHPLVPPCAAPEDWEKKSDEWEEETKMREYELWEAYKNADLLKGEVAALESRLASCDCEDGERKRQMHSMPAGSDSVSEANQKLRIRGRINEQEQINQEMKEELG